jgi:hypothetical protein
MSENSKRPTGVDARLQRLFDTAFRGHRIHALPPNAHLGSSVGHQAVDRGRPHLDGAAKGLQILFFAGEY